MQTRLAPEYLQRTDALEAEAIVRKCVHCGFCTATCPTYQLLGDELDGPRGRIYLIKQVLEGETPTRKTQQHLDRCLTCRNCESTCPSGVGYGHLVDIGRQLVDEKVSRPSGERTLRWLLKEGLNSVAFGPAMRLGQAVRGILPAKLRAKVPQARDAGVWPVREHSHKVLLLEGCVQPSMSPNINYATARVLDQVGVQVLRERQVECCGAIRFHLDDQAGARAQMRANIDAWWPLVHIGAVQNLVVNASGCGVAVKDYGHCLKDDPDYAQKAAQISQLTLDLSEMLPMVVDTLRREQPEVVQRLGAHAPPLVFHPPCTLQHGQKLRGGVEQHLAELGLSVRLAQSESHLCCGSAGTYSVLQPELSGQLRDRKLQQLHAQDQETIVSANIGCITHLQSGTATPVRHWVEVLDQALTQATLRR
jgi:glycolate oxidase iron-sulfur subunit